MDLGKFFGSIGSNVGGFFGALGNDIFGNNDDQKKKQQQALQQAAQSRPLTLQSTQQNNPAASPQAPNQLTPQANQQQAPKLGGVNPTQPPQKPDTNIVNNFGKFIGDNAGGFLNGVANTAKLVPDVLDEGLSHLVGSQTDKQNADKNIQSDYSKSMLPSAVNTVKLPVDLMNVGVSGLIGDDQSKQDAQNSLSNDWHNGLTAPLAGTIDTGNSIVKSIGAQNAYNSANQDALDKIKVINQQEQTGTITHNQAIAQRNALMGGVNQAASAASGANKELSAIDPYTAASNAAGVALMADGLKKAGGNFSVESDRPVFANEVGDTAEATTPAEAEATAAAQQQALHPNEPASAPLPITEEPATPPVKGAGGDPNSPITVTPTTDTKTPAITSPNRPAEPAQLTPAQPATVPGGVQPPVLEQPVRPTQSIATSAAPQEVKDVQQALDKTTTTPEPAPAPVENTVVQPASTKAAEKAVAAEPPVTKELLDQLIPEFTDNTEKTSTASPADEAPAQVAIPTLEHDRNMSLGKPSIKGPGSATYTTDDPNLNRIMKSAIIAAKGTAKTAESHASALEDAGFKPADVKAIRDFAVDNAKDSGHVDSAALEDFIRNRLNPVADSSKTAEPLAAATSDAPPTEGPAPAGEATPPAGKLGTITRQAVRDGSINTPEGVAKAEADTEAAAHAAAENAGTTIDDIIKKGQAAWEKSQTAGKDLTTKEAAEQVEGFTPEQQQVYKDYAQELHTLRDRSGHSLKGGNQGAWYGPRQFLGDEGKSGEYDPALVNENKRTGAKTNGDGNGLDYSPTPYSHYIRRYANAVDAGSQRIVGAAEDAGVRIPDTAKEQLESSLKQITDARDAADRQLAETGDVKTARASQKEVQKAIRQTFNDFIDNIPGSGSARREAINNVKAMRGTYEQTLTQTLTTSNLVNRLADQGTKLVEGAKRPLVSGLEKVINPIMKGHAMDGAGINALSTTKEARQAAKEFSRGTLGSEIMDNAKATVANAGAGRNPLLKGVAKVDASVRAAGGALTQTGDLSTSNVRDALQIGASRPEAAGLKTVADYKKYFADYTKTQKFHDDLAKVEELQNKKVGLAGGEVQPNGGSFSNGISKHVDNAIATTADKVKPGLGKNRLVREANDYVKGDITGYAGVTSRVLRSIADAALPVAPLKAAIKEAGSGDPAAVARATKLAAHAVADTIALHGTGVAAAALASSGIVGFTGAQPQQGSSESAFNKSHNVPANQWYLNLPGGRRVYFDPARPFAGPGVAADVAGTLATGAKDVGGALTDVGNQLFNQSGGNSIPQNIINAYNGYLNPSATDADKKYGKTQTESLLAPSTGVLNNVANWMDGVKRAPGNFLEDLKSNLPGQRPSVPAATDSFGNVIPNSHQVSGGSSIFSIGDNPNATQTDSSKADPIAAEISRLQNAGQKNVMPTTASTNATSAKNGGSNQEYAKLLVNDPMYQQADDKTKADMLHNILTGKANGVNDKLTTPDKQALIDHLLQGSDAKVWMQNNDNAVNYLTAKYNNDDANGNLTRTQKDMNHKGSLAQQIAVAKVNQQFNVDQDTINGYSDTSKAEFNNLADGSEEKNRLLAYDEALAKTGLPSKYQNKYGGYGSTSGKGGKGPSNFAFPSLPASLTGTGTSGSGKNGGYAAGTSLFTPIPALVAPTAANIPNGRSISVKPGVSL